MNSQEEARSAKDLPLPGGSFRLLIQKLGYQAMMGLGVVDNPITQSREVNVDQARMVIDDLRMLAEKTQGNLDEEEDQHLQGMLGELSKKLDELS